MSAVEETTNGKWVGQALRRKEDPRMITGRGNYVDDIALPGMLHATIVRSPEAHAAIVSIDKSAAEEHPGQLNVVGPAGTPGQEALVLLAQPAGADLEGGGSLVHRGHDAPPACATERTDLTMFW